jgi:hypothetical protein
MRRNGQAHALISLAIPGSSPVAGPAGAPSGIASYVGRRMRAGRGLQTGEQSWSRRLGLEREQLAFSLALLLCGVLLGLFVGGYAGFMDAATPPADSLHSLSQLATTDAQWVARMRQYSARNYHDQSVPMSDRELSWQRMTGGDAGTSRGCSTRLDAPIFRSVKKAVVTR